MGRIIFAVVLISLVFISCKKDNDEGNDTFIVTFDGSSYTCSGLKSFIERKDVDRMNYILGDESNYSATTIGLVDLKETYKKDDKIQVTVKRYIMDKDMVCPAFTPFPSVLVLKEELLKQ